jgi:hypothetical protein
MRKKKEPVEEIEETQPPEEVEQEPIKDIKLGEIELREGAVLVIKKTNYKGEDRVDFRVWLNTARYKGPTRQGFQLTMNKVDQFIKIVEDMRKKLE